MKNFTLCINSLPSLTALFKLSIKSLLLPAVLISISPSVWAQEDLPASSANSSEKASEKDSGKDSRNELDQSEVPSETSIKVSEQGIRTELVHTSCDEFEEKPNKDGFDVAFESSSLQFHLLKKSRHFLEHKNLLKDACSNHKYIDVSFDPKTQEITSIKFSAKQRIKRNRRKE